MSAILVILVINTAHLTDENGNVRNFGDRTLHYTIGKQKWWNTTQHYTFADANADVRNFGNQHHTFANKTSHRTTLLIKPALNFILHYTFGCNSGNQHHIFANENASLCKFANETSHRTTLLLMKHCRTQKACPKV
jgi:hypothetical protein